MSIRSGTIVSLRDRSAAAHRLRTRPACALLTAALFSIACAGSIGCRQLKMETFDSITGNFSEEFGVAEITPEEFRRRRSEAGKPPTLLIDVRTPEEQSISVLPGSVAVTPTDDLNRLDALQKFLRENKDRPDAMVVVYCAGGYRSARSMARIKSDSPVPLRNLRGGIIAWANIGGEIVEPAGKTKTNRVHGYNEFWGSFVLPPFEATVLPEIPAAPESSRNEAETKTKTRTETETDPGK